MTHATLRLKSWLVQILLVFAISSQIQASGLPEDATQVESFFDGMWQVQAQESYLAGGVITVVKDGQVYFSKGYGYADIKQKKRVDPAMTLFRIASISKPFTWTAVMQLVEAGKLDLHKDVNEYLTAFKVPAAFGAPITMAHLMSHSAGFEDVVLDLGRRDAADLLSLEDYLRHNLPDRVRPPGAYASYSNHSTALAAYIVQIVSGEDWSSYIESHILQPLKMNRTVMRHPFPDEFKQDLAKAYYRQAGEWRTEEFIHWQIYPAALVSTTGADMAKFMLAHLGDGSYNGGRILSPQSTSTMREALHAPISEGNDFLHGFYESSQNGIFIYGHGGDINSFHSDLMLLPEENIGVFISFNADTASGTRSSMSKAFIEQYFPAEREPRPQPPEDANEKYQEYTGEYASLRRSYTDFAKLAMLVGGLPVQLSDDGYLLAGNSASRYVEQSKDVFIALESETRMYFSRDADGEISHLSFSSYAGSTYDKQTGLRSVKLHQKLFAAVAIICLVYLIYWPSRFARRWYYKVETTSISKKTYLLYWLIALLTVVFLGALAGELGDTKQFYFEVPANIKRILLGSTLVSLSLIVLMPYSFYILWSKAGTVAERINFLALTFAICLFAVLCWYWQILAFYL